VTPLRIAFIGAGNMARQHLAVVQRLADTVSVVGVYDHAAGARDTFAELAHTQACSSIDALLTDTWPDVVHICTPPDAHFEAAYRALEGGAHVYVEKPFALALEQAHVLIELARARGRVICAGHQLLRDRAFETLITRGATLGPIVQVDSHVAFQPAGASATGQSGEEQAALMIDILPHPLYSLIEVMQRFAPPGTPVTLEWTRAAVADLQAVLRAGEIIGRLSVSLGARPVAASLTLSGARGALTCDFVRSIVVGVANPGTGRLEQVFNSIVEGLQLVSRTVIGVGRRVHARTKYPGLPELIGAFYRAAAFRGPSPVSPGHLLAVTHVFEQLLASVKSAVVAPQASAADSSLSGGRPSTV
jgi:predicted dehydrogenase